MFTGTQSQDFLLPSLEETKVYVFVRQLKNNLVRHSI